MTQNPREILVVGAGQAGLQLCDSLRKGGYDGRLTLIGEEPFPPYQRPPLSKAYLLGRFERERLFLKPESFYAENDIRRIQGLRAERIDRAEKRLHLANGESLPYDALVLATGARPRRLDRPGAELEGVHVIRTIADIDRLAPEIREGARAAILGGGYVGLEAAAALRGRGLEVTVIHRSERLLSRVAGEDVAAALLAIHEAEGVHVRLRQTLRAVEGAGRVERVSLERVEVDHVRRSHEIEIPADLVILGVGALPNQELARAADLVTEDGVRVDADCRTSDPAIWAIGDCAQREDPRYGPLRLESVQNAIDQAKIAAAAILGQPRPREQAPWFWSDQFDVKLQSAGLPQGYDSAVSRPGSGGRSGSVWLYREGALIAVEALNDAKAYMTGKRWIEQGHSPDPAAIADPARDLKTL